MPTTFSTEADALFSRLTDACARIPVAGERRRHGPLARGSGRRRDRGSMSYLEQEESVTCCTRTRRRRSSVRPPPRGERCSRAGPKATGRTRASTPRSTSGRDGCPRWPFRTTRTIHCETASSPASRSSYRFGRADVVARRGAARGARGTLRPEDHGGHEPGAIATWHERIGASSPGPCVTPPNTNITDFARAPAPPR